MKKQVKNGMIDAQARLDVAETDGDVVDAMEELLPKSEFERASWEREHRHMQFLEQLRMIEAEVPMQLTAIKNFLMDEKLRLRWQARGIKESRLELFRDNLCEIHQRHFCENREGSESQERRGMRTFSATISEANKDESVRIAGCSRHVELPSGAIEGEYHHFANGSESRKIGWHPDWENRLKTGALHGR